MSASENANLETGAGASAAVREQEPATPKAASPEELVASLQTIRSRVMPILEAVKAEYGGRTRPGYPALVDNVERGGVFGMNLDSGFGIYFMTDGERLVVELHLTHLRTDALSAANSEKFSGRPVIQQYDVDDDWDAHRYRDLVSRLLWQWNTQQTRIYRTDS